MNKSNLIQLDPLSRRRFAAGAAKSLLGVSMLPHLAGNAQAEERTGPGKATSMIFLYMGGGMTHLDTFDPKTNAEIKGPTTPISTNADGVQIANHLPLLAKQADKMAIIRSMTSTTGVHENGNYIMHTGYRPRATITHPCLGSFGQKLEGRRLRSLPDSVTIGAGSRHPGAGFLPASMKPVPLGNPEEGLKNINAPVSKDMFDHRLELANEFDEAFKDRFKHLNVEQYTDLYDEAVSLMTSEDLDAFNLGGEKAAMREKYGRNSFGQGCLLARRLVEQKVRYVEVNLGGWDMHNYIGEAITGRAGTLDQGLSALLEDLSQRGLLENTIVALGSEFGRTPNINMNGGRDHHPRAFSTILAGGGIRGGQVYGSTDKKGYAVENSAVSIQDFLATLGAAMGWNTEQRIFSPTNRPFTVGDTGEPVMGLFG